MKKLIILCVAFVIVVFLTSTTMADVADPNCKTPTPDPTHTDVPDPPTNTPDPTATEPMPTHTNAPIPTNTPEPTSTQGTIELPSPTATYETAIGTPETSSTETPVPTLLHTPTPTPRPPEKTPGKYVRPTDTPNPTPILLPETGKWDYLPSEEIVVEYYIGLGVIATLIVVVVAFLLFLAVLHFIIKD